MRQLEVVGESDDVVGGDVEAAIAGLRVAAVAVAARVDGDDPDGAWPPR